MPVVRKFEVFGSSAGDLVDAQPLFRADTVDGGRVGRVFLPWGRHVHLHSGAVKPVQVHDSCRPVWGPPAHQGTAAAGWRRQRQCGWPGTGSSGAALAAAWLVALERLQAVVA